MVLTIEQVSKVTFVVVVVPADLEEQRVFHDWAGDHATYGIVGTAASAIDPWPVDRCTELAGKLVGGIASIQEDCAAGHVATEQHALRPTQDFHAVEVEHVEHHAAIEAEIDAVNEDPDRRIDRRDRRVDAKTTDREISCTAACADLVQRHIGCSIGQRLDVAHFECIETVGIESRDR